MSNKNLRDTTLCAIVRDEKMNPAGGIGMWAHSHLPYVESAVVIDTGSIDGTLEELHELKKEYPHLEIYQHLWQDFADARNFGLEKIKTRRALVLDADELLTSQDLERLSEFVDKNEKIRLFGFNFAQLFPNLGYYITSVEEVMAYRLFDVEGINYHVESTGYSEDLHIDDYRRWLWTPVKIKHFLAPSQNREKKKANWYLGGGWKNTPPIEDAKVNGWKKFNPWRLKYPIPSKIDIDLYLKERGVSTEDILPIAINGALP